MPRKKADRRLDDEQREALERLNESPLKKLKLTKGDIPALKTIHNAAAGKGKHLRRAKDPRKVYDAARNVDAAAVDEYIAKRDGVSGMQTEAPSVDEYGRRQSTEQHHRPRGAAQPGSATLGALGRASWTKQEACWFLAQVVWDEGRKTPDSPAP